MAQQECPYCGSTNVRSLDRYTISQAMQCDDCNKTWIAGQPA